MGPLCTLYRYCDDFFFLFLHVAWRFEGIPSDVIKWPLSKGLSVVRLKQIYEHGQSHNTINHSSRRNKPFIMTSKRNKNDAVKQMKYYVAPVWLSNRKVLLDANRMPFKNSQVLNS